MTVTVNFPTTSTTTVVCGSSIPITWTCTRPNIVKNRVLLTDNGGVTYAVLGETPPTVAALTWMVGPVAGATCRVKVEVVYRNTASGVEETESGIGTAFLVTASPGPKGDRGDDGTDGVNGKDGLNGRDGLNGKDGINGVNGKDGVDGAPGAPGGVLRFCSGREQCRSGRIRILTVPFPAQPSGAPTFTTPPTVVASFSQLTLGKLGKTPKIPTNKLPPLRAVWANCVVKSVSQTSFQLSITPGPFKVSVSWIAYGA